MAVPDWVIDRMRSGETVKAGWLGLLFGWKDIAGIHLSP